MIVLFCIIVLIILGIVGIVYFDLPKYLKEKFVMASDQNGSTFFSSSDLQRMPPPRFGEADLNSVIRYPVYDIKSALPCQDCEPEQFNKEQTQTTPLPQSVVVDRLVFANRNSQLRAMGDPIRGDLPIVPNPPGWFTPSVSPHIDLQRGALNYLGGINSSTQQMDQLFAKASAGLLPSSSLPFSPQTSNAYAQLGNRGQDLTIISQL